MAGEWIGQLPDDLKTNEAFTGHATLGDFAKSHLEVQGKLRESEGKITGLETKLKDSIPKLPDDATQEERDIYFLSLGRPEKPEDYEFPENDGQKNTPEMIGWAGKEFHRLGLSGSQGKELSVSFNKFIRGMVNAEIEKSKIETQKADEILKTELGDKYLPSLELLNRFWDKHLKSDTKDYQSLDSWLKKPRKEGEVLGNDPYLIRLLLKAARLTGEDTGMTGIPTGEKKEVNWFPNTKF